MHKLKFEIISALQNSMCSTDKLVEVSNICDAYAKLVEGQKPTTNSAMVPCNKCKWSKGNEDYCSKCRWSLRDYFEAQHQ